VPIAPNTIDKNVFERQDNENQQFVQVEECEDAASGVAHASFTELLKDYFERKRNIASTELLITNKVLLAHSV
jgi:hypothetical protein